MSPARRRLLGLLAVAALVPAACGDPPDKEMQQAPRAPSTPPGPPAPTLRARRVRRRRRRAQARRDAVAERDYRLALNYALDSRERAQNAAKEAADSKAAARADADRALADAATRARTTAARQAEGRRERRACPPRILADARRTIAAGESGRAKSAHSVRPRATTPAVESRRLRREDTAGLQAAGARLVDAAAAAGARAGR